MLLRVGRDPCCTSLSLFDATPTATRVATQLLSQVRASVQPTRVSLGRCLSHSTPHLQPGKFSTRGLRQRSRSGKHCSRQGSVISQRSDRFLCSGHHCDALWERSIACDALMQRESLHLIHQRVWQPQSSAENPLRWRVPTVVEGRVASPGDSGGEPRHAVHLFRNKLDVE